MISSGNDIILKVYQNNRTVFRLIDVALLVGESNFQSLNKKLNYYVRTSKLENPRKGIYAKPGFNKEELACILYTPSYISLEYVLQKAGIIFQYDSRITIVSYLSRTVEIAGQVYLFRKLKGEILINTPGIIRQVDHINISSPERAFLDLLYLDSDYYFDNPGSLNQETINKLLPMFQSKALTKTVTRLLSHD
jgi:hypothetical protein